MWKNKQSEAHFSTRCQGPSTLPCPRFPNHNPNHSRVGIELLADKGKDNESSVPEKQDWFSRLLLGNRRLKDFKSYNLDAGS